MSCIRVSWRTGIAGEKAGIRARIAGEKAPYHMRIGLVLVQSTGRGTLYEENSPRPFLFAYLGLQPNAQAAPVARGRPLLLRNHGLLGRVILRLQRPP